MPVQKRYSGGQDIHGACGMLAAIPGEAGLAADTILGSAPCLGSDPDLAADMDLL